jgi:hypothetical protein
MQHFAEAKKANRWMWENVMWQDNGDTLIAAIANCKAIAVSDGMLKDGKEAASAVIEGRDNEGRVRLDSITSAEADQQSSFRLPFDPNLLVCVCVSL